MYKEVLTFSEGLSTANVIAHEGLSAKVHVQVGCKPILAFKRLLASRIVAVVQLSFESYASATCGSLGSLIYHTNILQDLRGNSTLHLSNFSRSFADKLFIRLYFFLCRNRWQMVTICELFDAINFGQTFFSNL